MRIPVASLAPLAFAFTTLAFTVTLGGCGSSGSDDADSASPEAVTSGSDVTDVESNALSLAASISSGAAGAQDLGDAAKTYYQPAGCLVVTDDSASSTATYVFTGCTGPHGLVTVDGTLTVGYSTPSATELKLSFSIDQPFTLTGAKGRQAILEDWAASADIIASGADLSTRTLEWSGRLSGTTRRGVPFDHSSTWEESWSVGGDCLRESGTSTGTIGKLSVTTTVSDYQVCADTCPAAGSEITVTGTSANLTYDLTYGTDTATYTGPLGRMYSYEPLCAE